MITNVTKVECNDAPCAMQLAALLSNEHPECDTTWYLDAASSRPCVLTNAPPNSALSMARMIGAIQ